MVAELFGAAFEDLDLDHVRGIVSEGEPESIVLELKETADGDSLAKVCSAFANTRGGLLVVGVRDNGELVGIPCRSEAQVWVKDQLRARVEPMPPFRARWLILGEDDDADALLLVLVEESSTTPHIVLRTGAIYVRSPGASDPLKDQRTLFELINRGADAQKRAEETAKRTPAAISVGNRVAWTQVSLVPTGVPSTFRDAAFSTDGRERLQQVATAFSPHAQEPWGWELAQHEISVSRTTRSITGEWTDQGAISSNGSLHVATGVTGRVPAIEREVFAREILAVLREGREALLDMGAHGDLLVVIWVAQDVTEHGRTWFENQGRAGTLTDGLYYVTRWTSFDSDLDRTVADVLRELDAAAGLMPRD